ncbi:MAG: cupin domain-containing protein [Candidatus Andersenbacteria bacterium]
MPDIISYIKSKVSKKSMGKAPQGLPKKIRITDFSEAKQVKKPWGFELWLAKGKEVPYALKIIYLKKGAKTSLQYHNQKAEHNCILFGKVRFYYQSSKGKNIRSIDMTAGKVIKVMPPAVHRVEALTDVLLVEASTDHLDDVVRLADDYSRPNGKIASEHV